jgi:hypothetical protein
VNEATARLVLVRIDRQPVVRDGRDTRHQRPSRPGGDLKRWLSYLASDELEGRATFTEGLGLAAAYIAEQLKANGVQPGATTGRTSSACACSA